MTEKEKTILIVDDEENIRRLVRSTLETDYTVLEARDGEEAVDTTRTQKPDLVLMDILMPNMDGYTACYEIKKDWAIRTIPVVMLSGLGYELNKKLAQDLAADGYITKPFSLQELLGTVKQYELATCPTAS